MTQPGTQSARASVRSVVLLWVVAGMVGLVGLAMALGGIVVVSLGGSPYYALIGAALTASATWLFLRRREGAWIYAASLCITVVWAVWEVGFDIWALMPRLLLLSALGALLLLPWTRAPLRRGVLLASKSRLSAGGVVATALAASAALGAAVFLLLGQMPADPRFQAGIGAFPQDSAASYRGVAHDDWPTFGGDLGGTRFTPLTQITPENVSRLQIAWDVDVGRIPTTSASPIKIGDTLYTCNNMNGVFALDARTGEQRWHHDASNGYGGTCRGVAYFETADVRATCGARIILGNATAQLRALDARTGELCPDFGDGGIVDLLVGMGDHSGEVVGGYYRVTSAPTIVRGRIIVGGWITDNQYWGSPSGVVRAFDAVTGDFVWAWDLGDPEDRSEPSGGESYTHSTPNSWAPMAGDEDLGLIYVPTGNATPDFFGGARRDFDDAFSTSLVALNAETGARVWSFQMLHHDLWDYDLPAQPSLLDLPGADGRLIPALVQPTKHGDIYVLNRATGEPIFDVTETPVPQNGAVAEERLAPTQPLSHQLPSFRGPNLREADMWGLTPLDQLYCRIRFAQARYEGPFTPPGLTPSILHPAAFGAINWGGVSVDPERGVMVVNSNRLANYVQLIAREEAQARGMRRQGAFASPAELALGGPQERTPYAVIRPYWLTALGVPCNAPPYGLISAVDLNSGRLIWSQRFGTALGSGPLGAGLPLAIPMGVPNHGGALTTRSGLVFIGATKDNLFQAYDVRTGALLWRVELPGGGGSAPISYTIDGRQYIVIHAGGNGAVRSRFSTRMVAFALPD